MLRSHIVVNSPLRPKFLLKCKIATALLCWRIRDSAKNQRSSTLVLNSTRARSEEHTSELQSLMRISYAVFCLKKKTQKIHEHASTPITPTNTKWTHTQEQYYCNDKTRRKNT